jgi:hypothetical protein
LRTVVSCSLRCLFKPFKWKPSNRGSKRELDLYRQLVPFCFPSQWDSFGLFQFSATYFILSGYWCRNPLHSASELCYVPVCFCNTVMRISPWSWLLEEFVYCQLNGHISPIWFAFLFVQGMCMVLLLLLWLYYRHHRCYSQQSKLVPKRPIMHSFNIFILTYVSVK